MDNEVFISVDTLTANEPLPFEPFKAMICAADADIMVRCPICEESTSMNSNDCRARGVFICDKCKAAVLHIRELLENGGSVT